MNNIDINEVFIHHFCVFLVIISEIVILLYAYKFHKLNGNILKKKSFITGMVVILFGTTIYLINDTILLGNKFESTIYYSSHAIFIVGFIGTSFGTWSIVNELLKLSHMDYLTQTFNGRYLASNLKKQERRYLHKKLPFSVIFMDIDRFKQINDTLGHEMGNMILSTIADTIKSQVRKGDIVGRYGGDEFLVVLANTHHVDALCVLNRIQEHVQELVLIKHHNIGISGGVATYPLDGNNIQDIIQFADKGMYDNKNIAVHV